MLSENRPFGIKVVNHGEVRMGSPYNSCDIELIGVTQIDLSNHLWQDKYAWSPNSKYLVLIKWDFENNVPGFHLFLVDAKTFDTKESPRIFGLPRDISIDDNKKVSMVKFLYDKEKSLTGDLCCNLNEEFEFI